MDEHVIATYARSEEVFTSGNGCSLYTREGRRTLDFLGGIGVSALGHAHPELLRALHEQVDKVLHVSNLFRHEHTEEVARRLARWTGLEACFFANSGAEANEAALKLARAHQVRAGRGDRTGFVALEGGFHGRTLGALSVTHEPRYRAPFEPLIPGVTFVPRNSASLLAEVLHAQKPAALILEPIQGEAGVIALDTAFLREARRLCTETGTVLIHDEVQSGCGRTGAFLAADHADVKPDVVTLAKPLAAGLPMGAMVAAPEFAAALGKGDHGSTFGGGPLVCSAATVMLDALESGLLDNVVERGAQLGSGLDRLAGRFTVIAEVRGRGLMRGLRLHEGAAELQRRLFLDGLVVNCTAGDVIRLLPPFVVTAGDVDRALELISSNLDHIPRLARS